jgi:hypothetical protein
MATIPTTVIGLAGTVINYPAVNAGGDQCATGPDVKLLVKNTSGVSTTVTLVTPGTVDGDLAIAERVFTVAAAGEQGVQVTDRYKDPATGLASFTCSPSTSVFAAVIR